MPDHPATLAETQLLSDCKISKTRRSGPGGQHRNKVETAVIITHTPTGISAEANERRSQEANRKQALHRLRLKLAIEVRTRPGSNPTPLWQGRVKGGRIAVNPDHADFPALLSEALNQIEAGEFEMAAAANNLGVSSTQLVKLVRLAPAAFAWFNQQRTTRGLHPLK